MAKFLQSFQISYSPTGCFETGKTDTIPVVSQFVSYHLVKYLLALKNQCPSPIFGDASINVCCESADSRRFFLQKRLVLLHLINSLLSPTPNFLQAENSWYALDLLEATP
ncbi:MAG: hypothetical protein ACK5V5_13690 [Cyclobacteriaceae bacterium]|jgi:hypothetical protein|nr:hypothetical protein [Flammeovirgaceae bacterium]